MEVNNLKKSSGFAQGESTRLFSGFRGSDHLDAAAEGKYETLLRNLQKPLSIYITNQVLWSGKKGQRWMEKKMGSLGTQIGFQETEKQLTQ